MEQAIDRVCIRYQPPDVCEVATRLPRASHGIMLRQPVGGISANLVGMTANVLAVPRDLASPGTYVQNNVSQLSSFKASKVKLESLSGLANNAFASRRSWGRFPSMQTRK
jgi:hypothetical protein